MFNWFKKKERECYECGEITFCIKYRKKGSPCFDYTCKKCIILDKILDKVIEEERKEKWKKVQAHHRKRRDEWLSHLPSKENIK